MPTPLATGKSAPSFSLSDKEGNVVSLKKIAADFTVVYFYPKDNTPGCAIESKAFSRDLKALEKLGATVVGISGGDQKSKTSFCKKEKLTVTLLSDSDFSVAKKFGVFGEKTFMGRKFLGIFRTTFLLDSKLKVIKVYEKVSPETHSAEVIADIQGLVGKPAKKPAITKSRKKQA